MVEGGQATNPFFFNDNKDLRKILRKLIKQKIFKNHEIADGSKCRS